MLSFNRTPSICKKTYFLVEKAKSDHGIIKAPFGYAVPGHSWPRMVPVLFKILKKPQLRNDSGQELW